MIERTLLWTPRTKGRPRTVSMKGGYRTYTPRETVEAERSLAQQWVGQPVNGPIMVGLLLSDVDVRVSIVDTAECVSMKLRRGDIDNYAKLIMDALNGVAWVDDRQIVTLSARKV